LAPHTKSGSPRKVVRRPRCSLRSLFETGTPTPAGVLKLAPQASFAKQDRTKERLKAEARHGGVLVVQGDAEPP
jgi:hypothetical protein